MIYRDPNLQAPDIAQYFPFLHSRVMPHSMGQEVLSDWSDKAPDDPCFLPYEKGELKDVGLLSHDEAAIVYLSAKQVGGRWLDIGCHTGWTALHMAFAGAFVEALDNMFASPGFKARAEGNIDRARKYNQIFLHPYTSRMYFGGDPRYPLPMMDQGTMFDGVLIDGDHCTGEPEYDAQQSFKYLNPRGVILMHDFIGGPVTRAVTWLIAQGMKCRIYYTSSQLLAVTWRGEFTPPNYTPDPSVDWKEYGSRVTDFDWRQCV